MVGWIDLRLPASEQTDKTTVTRATPPTPFVLGNPQESGRLVKKRIQPERKKNCVSLSGTSSDETTIGIGAAMTAEAPEISPASNVDGANLSSCAMFPQLSCTHRSVFP